MKKEGMPGAFINIITSTSISESEKMKRREMK